MTFRSEIETLVGALRFFTRLPIPGPFGHESLALERAIRFFPLAGLLIGGLAAAAFVLTALIWPRPLAVLAAIVTAIYVTGALHEDGWSDTVDGFGGGWTRERILEIMRDSCIGSFGATALVMILLARFFTLVEIDPFLVPAALLGGHAVSRLYATLLMASLDYARPDGKAKAFDNRIGAGGLGIAVLTAGLPLLFLPPSQVFFALLLAALATLWLRRMFRTQIGGYTGDCLGAVQQLSEVAFYAGLLVRLS